MKKLSILFSLSFFVSAFFLIAICFVPSVSTAADFQRAETGEVWGEDGGRVINVEGGNWQSGDDFKAQYSVQGLTAAFAGSNISSGSSSIFIIILLLVIIILLVLLLKKKNNTAGEKVNDAPKHTSKAEKHEGVTRADLKDVKSSENIKAEENTKKGRNWLKILVIGVIVYFVLSFMVSSIGFLPLGFVPAVFEELRGKFGQQINQQDQSLSPFEKEAQTPESFSKISLPGESNLAYSAVEKARWPQGTVGGLYEIKPSGNFSKLGSIIIDLKDNVQKGFALGYWHADTQKWEYIPTIRIFGNTYKALLAHASEVGGYNFGLAGALEYEPQFQDPGIQTDWESLKADLEKIADHQAAGFNTDIEVRIAIGKLDNLAIQVINQCAGSKTFASQMDYFFIWNIAQLLNATEVDERLGDAMRRCIDIQTTRADSKYEYMIRENQDLDNDLNIPELMQFVWKGKVSHEGYPILSGYGNTDWRTDWQVVARTEYSADVQYGSLLESYDIPTPEGTFGNNIVTHVMLFSLKDIREGDSFKIRGVSIGDAPGYFRNWHEDFKWRINHPSTSDQPTQSDPNKNVFDITGTLVEDRGKNGAVIKYGGISKEQQAQLDQVTKLLNDSGDIGLKSIPAYYQEAAGQMTLNIVPGIPYNE